MFSVGFLRGQSGNTSKTKGLQKSVCLLKDLNYENNMYDIKSSFLTSMVRASHELGAKLNSVLKGDLITVLIIIIKNVLQGII